MSTIQDIRNQLSTLVTEAHKVACALDIGDERTRPLSYDLAHRRTYGAGRSHLISSRTGRCAMAAFNVGA
jgi:hypothetical protein